MTTVVVLGVGAFATFRQDDPDRSIGDPTTLDPEMVPFDCAPWDALGGGAPAAAPADEAPLAADDALVRDALPNGLQYFVRSNDRPGASASLALAVDAGAAFEDDDQGGAAHFLEHMLFNGTERFPGNELEDVLADLGVSFGADLNAFTSEDETVYYLEIPNDEASIDAGLDVLLEWATKATIAPDEVDAERGVILEEMRSRSGPDDRFRDRLRDLSLADTPYEDHEVIGTVESIGALTANELRRFYEDWYRPELMSVVAVGDFDPGVIEAKIVERFAAIHDGGDGRVPPTLDVETSDSPRFGAYLDDELAGTSAEVVFTTPAVPELTNDALARRLRREVALSVVDRRLNDDAARGLVPFYEVDVQTFDQVRAFESSSFSVDAEPGLLGESLEAVLAELARVRRDGMRDDEVARAIQDRRASAAVRAASAGTTQDRDFLFRFVDSGFGVRPTSGSDVIAGAELATLDAMTAAAVSDEFRRMTPCTEMSVQAGVPSEYEVALPDEARILEALVAVTSPDALSVRAADAEAPTVLMAAPEPASPVSRIEADLFGPATMLDYPNGVRVIVNPSDIVGGSTSIVGERPGGLAAVADDDVSEAAASGRLVSASGVGDLDTVDLQRFLAGRSASASTFLGPDTDGVVAGGSAADLEAVLQLINQRMTNARIDEGAAATFRGESRLLAENPGRRADSAIQAALSDLYWQNDIRVGRRTTEADLETFDPDRALEVHRDRFGNASGFVFAIVGDFDPAVAEDLAARYLGTLPSAGPAAAPELQLPPPLADIARTTVEAGAADQGAVTVAFDVANEVGLITRDRSALLSTVLSNRLSDRLREELGATYSPNVTITPDERSGRIRSFVTVESDPARAEEVASEIQAVIDSLRMAGPTEAELDRALEPIIRDLQFIDDELIARSWIYLAVHPDSPFQDLPAAAELRLEGVDTEAVRSLAAELLPAGAYVEIIQKPK